MAQLPWGYVMENQHTSNSVTQHKNPKLDVFSFMYVNVVNLSGAQMQSVYA